MEKPCFLDLFFKSSLKKLSLQSLVQFVSKKKKKMVANMVFYMSTQCRMDVLVGLRRLGLFFFFLPVCLFTRLIKMLVDFPIPFFYEI